MSERIAIFGAPGTGKSEVANALRDALGPEDWIVIDDVATDLARDYKLHIGAGTDYLPNLLIFLQRALRERAATLRGLNIISVGTDIDTLAYIAVQIELYSNQPRTELVKRQAMKNMHSAAVISMALEDMWDYDYLFYMPVPDRFKIVIPNEISSVEQYDEYYTWVDEAIVEGFRAWKINPARLTGSIAAKTAEALSMITTLREQKEGKNGGGS